MKETLPSGMVGRLVGVGPRGPMARESGYRSARGPFGREFEVANAMRYEGMPPFGRIAPLSGQRDLYADDVARSTPPTEADFRAAAAILDRLRPRDAPCTPFDIVDHESHPVWPFADGAAFLHTLEFHADLVAGVSRATGRPVATYGVVPPLSLVRSKQGRRPEWRAPFQLAAYVLGDVVAVATPSMYTPYGSADAVRRAVDIAHWITWCRDSVADWRAVSELPIMPFLWPRYHAGGGSPLALGWIHDDFWRAQLETVREVCDGVVLWGGFAYDGAGRWQGRAAWDPSAAWWRIARDVLGDLPSFGRP